MIDIENLLAEKYNILCKVLELCNKTEYTADQEENINHFIALYDDRAKLFERIKEIDDAILSVNNNKNDIVNNKIKEVSKKILEFDRDNLKNKDEFEVFLNNQMKTINQERLINNRFNSFSFDEITGFSIEG